MPRFFDEQKIIIHLTKGTQYLNDIKPNATEDKLFSTAKAVGSLHENTLDSITLQVRSVLTK